MPEYSLLAGIYLAAAALASIALGLHRRRSAWVTLAVFATATVVFDLVLTGLPIVTYGDASRSGIALGPMPIEDLVYGLALCLTVLSAWTWARRRGIGR